METITNLEKNGKAVPEVLREELGHVEKRFKKKQAPNAVKKVKMRHEKKQALKAAKKVESAKGGERIWIGSEEEDGFEESEAIMIRPVRLKDSPLEREQSNQTLDPRHFKSSFPRERALPRRSVNPGNYSR